MALGETIVFSKSGRSDLTLERAQVYPLKNTVKFDQKRYTTEGGTSVVINLGSPTETITLSFEGLSRANFDDATDGLKTWFESTQVNGSVNSFTMVDEDGDSRTVRLWQDSFTTSREEGNLYAIKFKLKVE